MTINPYDWYDKDGNPVSEESTWEWADRDSRQVALTDVGPYRVSTVWLGRSLNEHELEIFETMIWVRHFGIKHDRPIYRHSANDREALAFHKGLVAGLRLR